MTESLIPPNFTEMPEWVKIADRVRLPGESQSEQVVRTTLCLKCGANKGEECKSIKNPTKKAPYSHSHRWNTFLGIPLYGSKKTKKP